MITATHKLSKTKQNQLLKQFKNARNNDDVEKAVERAVIDMLEMFFHSHPEYQSVTTSYPFNTDGILEVSSGLFGQPLTILVETKRDKQFTENRKDILEVCAQVISYLRQIETHDPHKYPNVIVIADNNEIFLIPTTLLNPYTEKDYNWSLPASEMRKDTALIADLTEDKNIRPFVHDITENFDISDFCSHLITLAHEAGPTKIKIGKPSLSDAFENFRKLVFGTNDPNVIQSENRRQIEIFSRTLLGDEDVYSHPKKKNVLLVDGVELENIDTEGYELFATRYDANHYSFDEYKKITQMSDTLIAEANRRFRGDYYTPKVWVDEAHRMISEQLGEDWKDEYVVWDPAAGTKNLTRDYKFSNLFSSTLYEGELMATNKFNKDNVSFQYDFLNDDMCLHDGMISLEDLKSMTDEQIETTLKMPLELVKKLLNKEKIVFFTNPPYGANGSQAGKVNKKDVANTRTKKIMLQRGQGEHAAQELYTQIIYRVTLLAEAFGYTDENPFHFFFFNKGFLISPSFSKYVDNLTSKFTFHKGFMLNAGEFDGTDADWGIIFSHWTLDQTTQNQNEFKFDVLEQSANHEVIKTDQWIGSRVDKGSRLNDWVREVHISRDIDTRAPVSKNEYEKSNSKNVRVKMHQGWIGYMRDDMCSVQNSNKYTFLRSLGYFNAHGIDVTRENFERIAVSFSVRRSIRKHFEKNNKLWIHDKSIFKYPSQTLTSPQFMSDCVVYALFDDQSQQTSLRNYEYNGNTYRMENEFFPFSIDFVNQLAIEHNNLDIQADLQGDEEMFVYAWLKEHDEYLSPEATQLLDLAKQLYEETFPYRDEYAQLQPRFQTNSWDAGYAQIARLAFGNDRINDEFLDLKEQFYTVRARLGEKIAQAAIDDGII